MPISIGQLEAKNVEWPKFFLKKLQFCDLCNFMFWGKVDLKIKPIFNLTIDTFLRDFWRYQREHTMGTSRCCAFSGTFRALLLKQKLVFGLIYLVGCKCDGDYSQSVTMESPANTSNSGHCQFYFQWISFLYGKVNHHLMMWLRWKFQSCQSMNS